MLIHAPSDLVRQQCAVLRSSRFSRHPLDFYVAGHVELASFLARVQADLDPSRRLGPLDRAAVYARAEAFNAELDRWFDQWQEGAETMESGLNAFTLPYHHAKLYIHKLCWFACSTFRQLL